MNLLSKQLVTYLNQARDKRNRKTIILHPNPDLRRKRAEQFSPERAARYWRNVAEMQEMLNA